MKNLNASYDFIYIIKFTKLDLDYSSVNKQKENENISQKKLDIRSLKDFVSKNLSLNSTLRNVILEEDDQVTDKEFIIKLDVWLKLFRLENN